MSNGVYLTLKWTTYEEKTNIIGSGRAFVRGYGEEAPAINATANLDRQFQTIESFTASDAWSGNFIGKFFADDKKEKLAKWLFSQKYGEDGSPEGIGLSMWRINIGGGTWEQEGAVFSRYNAGRNRSLQKTAKTTTGRRLLANNGS